MNNSPPRPKAFLGHLGLGRKADYRSLAPAFGAERSDGYSVTGDVGFRAGDGSSGTVEADAAKIQGPEMPMKCVSAQWSRDGRSLPWLHRRVALRPYEWCQRTDEVPRCLTARWTGNEQGHRLACRWQTKLGRYGCVHDGLAQSSCCYGDFSPCQRDRGSSNQDHSGAAWSGLDSRSLPDPEAALPTEGNEFLQVRSA